MEGLLPPVMANYVEESPKGRVAVTKSQAPTVPQGRGWVT